MFQYKYFQNFFPTNTWNNPLHTVQSNIVVGTKLHASRPRKDFTPPPPLLRAALSQQFSVASFATLRFLRCLHSPGVCCSFCNVVRFYCDLEACNLLTTTIAMGNPSSQKFISERSFILHSDNMPITKSYGISRYRKESGTHFNLFQYIGSAFVTF
jgi:hypothetical protein